MKRTRLFNLAINAARQLSNVLIGIATNVEAASITDEKGGFVLLAPYGDTPYWHKEDDAKDQWTKYTQSFQRPQADAMVSAFNATLGKKGASYKGLPIYNGHPDADKTRWPDERRLGGVMALDAREDGLYAKPAWNSLGQENVKEGFLVYPSPAWLYDKSAAKSSRTIRPNELRSVGMTNSPNIQEVIPWVNSADPNVTGEAAAVPTATNVPNWLVAVALGLEPAANETDISAAATTARIAFNADAAEGEQKPSLLEWLKEQFAKPFEELGDDVKSALRWLIEAKEQQAAVDRLKAELGATATNSQARISGLESEVTRYRTLAADGLLDLAVNTSRITASEREGFVTAFNADFDGARAKLDAKQPALNTTALNLHPSAPGLDTPHGRSLAFNSRLEELQRPVASGGKGLRFEDAISYMRSSAEDKALITAMDAAK